MPESSDPIPSELIALESYTHFIDTVASNISNFRSMILTNSGTIYYIGGHTIYNTATADTLDLYSSFGAELKNPYLAYDPYHDIVYLLAGGTLTIHNISDFSNPSLILNKDTCPSLVRPSIGGKLANTSSVTPQIAVLDNGSLLIPFDQNGTWMVNPNAQTVTQTTRLYFISAPEVRKVLGNSVISFRAGEKNATLIPLGGSNGSPVALETAGPWGNATSVISRNGLIYYYDDSCGVCTIASDGSLNILISLESINVKDHQSLTATNIWCLDANQNGEISFYDNSLKCIRKISTA